MFHQLLNLLLDSRLALVHTTFFDAGDGPAEWANNLNELYLLKHNLNTELALAEKAQAIAT